MPSFVATKELSQLRPRSIRLMLAQITTESADWEIRDGLYYQRDVKRVKRAITQLVALAKQHVVEVLVLPELSVPVECLGVLQAWSKEGPGTAIAGSHYHRTEGRYVARCPVMIGGEVMFTEKMIPAPVERSPVPNQGLSEGKQISVFKNTPLGNFAVLICSDYLDSRMRQAVLEHQLDFVFVPAFQKESDLYHSRMNIDCEESERGVYCVYSNMRCGALGDGRSAIFGVMDSMFSVKLKEAGLTDGNPRHKAFELTGGQRYAIFDIDIDAKRATLPRTVHSKPNVNVISVDDPRTAAVGQFAEVVAHNDERYRQIDSYYVAPKELPSILSRLEKSKLAFIIGDPGIGKTYTAAMILKGYYDKGYKPIWFTGLEREERRVQRLTLENFEPQDRQVIYFEDPFGQVTFEKRDSLFAIFAPLVDRLQYIDARVIITSRKEVFERFSKESLSSRELTRFVEEMNVVKPSYSSESLKEILGKLATGRCEWYEDHECRAAVEAAIDRGEMNTPLGIRDLIYVTERETRVHLIRSAIRRREQEEVLAFTREVLACDHATKLVLALVYLCGPRGQGYLATHFEALSRRWDADESAPQHAAFVHVLRNQLGYRVEQYGRVGTVLRFTHPTYEEAVAEAGLQDATMERIMSDIVEIMYRQDFAAALKALNRHSTSHLDLTTQLFAVLAELVHKSGDLSQVILIGTRLVSMHNLKRNEQLRAAAVKLIDPPQLAKEIAETASTTQLTLGLRLAAYFDSKIGADTGSMIAPLIDWEKVFLNVKRAGTLHQLLGLFEWVRRMQPARAVAFINSLPMTTVKRLNGEAHAGNIKRVKRVFNDTLFLDHLLSLGDTKITNSAEWRRTTAENISDIPIHPALVVDAELVNIYRKSRVSLLPAGIVDVVGEFSEASVVSILTPDGRRIGAGIVEYNSEDIRSIKGHHSSHIAELIGRFNGVAVARPGWWLVLPADPA